MDTRTSSRQILAENINRLMQSTLALNSNTKLVKRSGLGLGTMGRVRNAEAVATIDTLDRLAECFGVQPWQLLEPQDVTQLPPAEQPLIGFQPALPPQPGIQPSSTALELGLLFDLLTDRDGKVDRAEVFSAAVEAISRAVTGRQVQGAVDAGEYAALGLPRMADQPVVDCQLAASKIVQLVSVRARFGPAGPNLAPAGP